MAHFTQRDVLLVCSCGSLRPLTKLYFCRHCIVLRCGYCVGHEIDSIYCSNCLENLASSEAKVKKNRCGSCFECPYCFHTLSVRATVSKVSPSSGEAGQATVKPTKSFYLACFSCRWTSRDVKIPDQPMATSKNWPKYENPHTTRINALIEFYKVIALRERIEKEKKTYYLPRRGYPHFSEKFGLTSVIARKRAGLPPVSLGREDFSSEPEIDPAIASEEVEPLPEDIFNKPVDVASTTTLRQRYLIPDLQPENISQLFPVHKRLFSKRSERCRSCLHNVFKPEYSPASIKFKLYMAAIYHVPEIRLMKKTVFTAGSTKDVLIKISNPTPIATSVTLLPISDLSVDISYLSEREETIKQQHVEPTDKTYVSSVGQKRPIIIEKVRPTKMQLTGDISLPNVSVNLLRRDDTVVCDDSNDSGNFHDDPKLVIWRRANKVIIKLPVTAHDCLKEHDDVVVGFTLRYVYWDKMISALEQKEGKNVNIAVKYILNVGSVENANE